ncbi:aminoglycoside phosphotransferase family protein [Patescibacteria group bacterium]|nr:aminoglycoside phosphotransferase family protein [Patescibacteria group bacterium]MBU1921873.1 aminoglycoside phosphotransferase family protein [Patescibacteria group bacterium]
MAKNSLKTHLITGRPYLENLLKKALKTREIQKILVYPVKVRLTPAFEHVVLAVKVRLGKGRAIGLYAMGHSNGIKEKSFYILKFLRERRARTRLAVPEPLLYDVRTKAIIYKELNGPNLYALFEKKKKRLGPIFAELGRCVARLHALQPGKIFKKHEVSLNELDPTGIRRDIELHHPDLFARISAAERKLARIQKKVCAKSVKRVLVHGDLHPENVIVLNHDHQRPKLGLIDVENAGLADSAYDLGSFLEQVKIMAAPFYDAKTVQGFQNRFFKSYTAASNIKVSPDFEKRINFYKAFFGLKAAIFYFELGRRARMGVILKRVEKYLDELEFKNTRI